MFILIIIFLLLLTAYLFLNQPSFGAIAKGERMERIQRSPNYRDGKFHNLKPTPMMTKDASFVKIATGFIFGNGKTDPEKPIPALKSDLKKTTFGETKITWFGHSSYLIQSGEINFLVDPVFSQRTSPVQWAGTKAFSGTDIYGIDDLPVIHYVILTHDHYDHLDYNTILKLKDKTGKFVTALGVGAHLEKWGILEENIFELDWEENIIPGKDLNITCTPARHFSGRGMIKRNQSLWASFILKINGIKIFIGGDSGYDSHFKTIGEKYGPFDIAMLECGQYNKFWPYIHMFPEETVLAAQDLQAKVFIPVHWGKFKLSSHHWNEPARRAKLKATELGINITTPKNGEPIILGIYYPKETWWENLDN